MSSYDNFAKTYSDSMGDTGDEVHQTQIDPYVFQIIGDPKGKTLCDLGCGNGYMARYFAQKGARVFASDISLELVNIAESKSQNSGIQYLVHSADDLSAYKDNFFDVVVMNMSIHYLKDLNQLFAEVSRVLKTNGVFVFYTSHFFRPNYPYSEWVLGKIEDKDKLFIKVTDYLEKRENKVLSDWDHKTTISVYNHPLNELINSMSQNGLLTFKIFEPEPINAGWDFSEELQKNHHIPTYLIVGAKKISV